MTDHNPIISQRELDDAASAWGAGHSATTMRDLRQHVKQIASLVTTGYNITESPGAMWGADLTDRVIYWRATSSTPPNDILNSDELLHEITEKAFNIRFSGRWKLPEDADPLEFWRFISAMESMRVGRLAGEEFASFSKIAQAHRQKELRWHFDEAEGYSRLDQVLLSYMALEYGMEPLGTKENRDFAKDTWEMGVSRTVNAASTGSMASMLEAIYNEIKDADEQGRAPSAANIPSDFADDGADSPSSTPSKDPEEGGEDEQSLGDHSEFQKLMGMAQSSTTQEAQDRLTEALQQEIHNIQQGAAISHMMTGEPTGGQDVSELMGQHAGMISVDNPGTSRWEQAKQDVRPQINVLARQLESKLQHNAQDDWRSGQRRGQLEVNRAFRSLISDFSIFRDRTEVGEHDYNFLIAVDRSGSQGSRIGKILESVVLVVESLERAGLRNAVIPWDTVPQSRKGFMDPLSHEMKDRVGSYVSRTGGGTYEAPVLIIAQEEFRKVRGRKVLITITDGQTNNPDESERLMAELESEGVVCLAISVKCAVPRHYRHSIRIDDVSDLSRLLPTFVAQTIRRG